MNTRRNLLRALIALLPAASNAVLVTTWTADNAALGDAGVPSVLLEASPVTFDMTSSVSGTGTNYTDVIALNATQQAQLNSAGLSVTQGLDNVRGATRKLNALSFDSFGTQGGSGNVTTRNATIDFFISPDNLNDVSQLIFETGGSGAGTSVFMAGSTMTFAAAQNVATAAQTSVDLSTIYSGTPVTTDMIQVRLGFDLTNDEIILSVLNLGTNLAVSSSVAFTGTDWAGTDGSGLFNIQGTTGGSAGGNAPASFSNFDGQLGGIRFYTDEVLPQLVPEPSSSLLLVLAMGFLGSRRQRK